MKLTQSMIICLLLTLGSIGFAQDLAADVGKGAKDVGKAAETVGKDTLRGTEDAAKDAAHATDKAAKVTARSTQKVAEKGGGSASVLAGNLETSFEKAPKTPARAWVKVRRKPQTP